MAQPKGCKYQGLKLAISDYEKIDTFVTDWFPSSVAPVYTGQYQVTDNKNPNWPFPVYAVWDGTIWSNVDIVQWRGLANKPE